MDPRHPIILSSAAAFVLAVTASPALAGGRNFAYTYGYATGNAGDFGIELHGDFDSAPGGQAELEYSFTDHLSAAAKVRVVQATGVDSLSLKGTARLAEPGEWPVDTGLVAELERPLDMSLPMTVRGILVAEKRVGKVVTDGNVVLATALAPGSPQYGANLGLGYQVTEAFQPGIQIMYGDTEFGDGYANKLFAGASVKETLGHTAVVGGLLYGGANEVRGTLVLVEDF